MGNAQSARDALIAEVRRDIISGRLKPGQHLVEQTIADEKGFSRGPVREALAVLQKLGFVTHVRNRGVFVSEINVSEGREIYYLRGILEGQACGLAATNGTDAEIEELGGINARMQTTEGDVDAFVAANVAFHNLIRSMSRSPILNQLIEDLLDRSRKFREAGLFASDAVQNAFYDHTLVLEAIRQRDAELARLVGARAVFKRWPGLLESMLAQGQTSPNGAPQADR